MGAGRVVVLDINVLRPIVKYRGFRKSDTPYADSFIAITPPPSRGRERDAELL